MNDRPFNSEISAVWEQGQRCSAEPEILGWEVRGRLLAVVLNSAKPVVGGAKRLS